MATTRKVIIIGSGPSGYTAAIYAARANLSPVMFTGIQAGGQLMLTTLVENYPGFVDGIDGPPLMETFQKQAERFGTEMIADDVTEVDFRSRPFKVTGGDVTMEAHTVIVATGASAKLLGLPNEAKLMGRGVSTCATCDGFFFKDQNIMVVGGGDSALEEALYLSRLGRKVEVVHRRESLRGSKIMQERAFKNSEDHVPLEHGGGGRARSRQGQGHHGAAAERQDRRPLGVPGGRPLRGDRPPAQHRALQGPARPAPERVHQGDAGHHADVGAGRVRGRATSQDFTYRQAVTAAGTGCMAALEAERYLEAEGLGE